MTVSDYLVWKDAAGAIAPSGVVVMRIFYRPCHPSAAFRALAAGGGLVIVVVVVVVLVIVVVVVV